MDKQEFELCWGQLCTGFWTLLFFGSLSMMILEFFNKPGHPFSHPREAFLISAFVCLFSFACIYFQLYRLRLVCAKLMKKAKQGEMDSLYARVAMSDHC
jgi:hypothetical protein